MRDTLEREWTDYEIMLATQIVQLVWDGQPNSVGKGYIAVSLKLPFRNGREKEASRKRIEDLMPLVQKVATKSHVGHSILTKPTGELLFTTNAYLVVKQELIRIHQMFTKLTRIDDSFSVLKECNDPTLRSFAYKIQTFREILLTQDEEIKEVMQHLGIYS